MGVRYQRAADLVELTGILQTTSTGLTIDEVAERFVVSRRTAERMLGALRTRFPELAPSLHSGRKYWKLPGQGQSRAIQLPRTVDALSERISQLEAEVAASRSEVEGLRCISDGVISTSPVGIMILDADRRVVRTNPSLSGLFGFPTERLVGLELEDAAAELARVVAEPERVAQQLIADRSVPGDDFECSVTQAPGCPTHRLRHWSRPLEGGAHAGGRVDRWLLLEASPSLPAGRSVAVSTTPSDLGSPLSAAQLRDHVAQLRQATAEWIESHPLSPEVATRLKALSQAHAISLKGPVEIYSRGASKQEPMSPAEVLELARFLIEPRADERGIRLRVEADPSLPSMFGDRALTVSGLVLNMEVTLEALPRGASLLLRASRLDDPDRVRISIIDSGPRLPDDFPAFQGIFERFAGGSGRAIGVLPARDGDGNVTGIEQYFELSVC